MSAQEKAVIKAMRRHQRDGRRFRDLLVHCACGWKSPALKARKGSNDFALAREDQAKSFERHVAREVLAATDVAEAEPATATEVEWQVVVHQGPMEHTATFDTEENARQTWLETQPAVLQKVTTNLWLTGKALHAWNSRDEDALGWIE